MHSTSHSPHSLSLPSQFSSLYLPFPFSLSILSLSWFMVHTVSSNSSSSVTSSIPPPASIASIPLLSSFGLLPQGTVSTLSQSLSPAVATVMSTGLPNVQASRNPTAQFSLSSSFISLPAKLVSKIRSLQYIDMKELLPDNIGLARSLDGSELEALPMHHLATRPKLRQIPSIVIVVKLCWSCRSPLKVTATPCPVTLSIYVSNYLGS